MKPVALIGAAFSVGGASPGTRRGCIFYRRSACNQHRFRWLDMIWQPAGPLQNYPQGLPALRHSCRQLAQKTAWRRRSHLPVIIGGDHSCAIGTWHGMYANRRRLGLLWIDAHFDSHTPVTSQSLHMHGMPLAVLLGESGDEWGWPAHAVVDARHTVVFGVRSFEEGEPQLLQRHGVRFYTMNEIRKRGLYRCLTEAWRLVAASPGGFGVSLDLDGLDPSFAPAVSVREPRGLSLPRLRQALAQQRRDRLKALEITEFNPYREHDKRTVKALTTLIVTLTSRSRRRS